MIKTALGVVFGVGCAVPQASAQPYGDLLTGDAFDGWATLGGRAVFTIDAGVVSSITNSASNTFLRSPGSYDDFVLRFETRVQGGPSAPHNSGVQFRSINDNGRVRGYQLDYDAMDLNKAATLYEEGNGRLTLHDGPDYTELRDAFIPFEQGWNQIEVIADGPVIQMKLNGVPGQTYVESRAPASDGLYPIGEGFLALQVHGIGLLAGPGLTVQWRAISVAPLPTVPGDTDGDADIDDIDLGTAFSNYTGPVDALGGLTRLDGDTDGDADIDDADLGTSFAGYTGPLTPRLGDTVPEPASLTLLAVCGLVAVRRRHA